MLVVVAARGDAAAQAVVARWAAHGAALLTCADLSVPGWRHHVGGPAGSATAVADGRVVETARITGLLTLLPCVLPHELTHIVPGDREFVAQEMTAFLLAWLSRLECPVLNRPTPTSLAGPMWPSQWWRHTAARAGLRVTPLRRRTATATGPPADATPVRASVTVLGDRWVGDVDEELAVQARRLADTVGVELLTVFFDRAGPGAVVLGADPRPALTDARVADAVLAHLTGGAAAGAGPTCPRAPA